MTTKTKESDCAYKLEVNGGEFGEIEKTEKTHNFTTIFVKSLAFVEIVW